MLEMDGYDEPDADSDFDYEESYSKRRKSRKNASKVRIIYYFFIYFLCELIILPYVKFHRIIFFLIWNKYSVINYV